MARAGYDFNLMTARSLSGSHTQAEWVALKKEFHSRCVRCLKRFPLGRGLTKDHIVPLSKGGTDTIDNIQPMCMPCNTASKKARVIDYREQARGWLAAAPKRKRKADRLAKVLAE